MQARQKKRVKGLFYVCLVQDLTLFGRLNDNKVTEREGLIVIRYRGARLGVYPEGTSKVFLG